MEKDWDSFASSTSIHGCRFLTKESTTCRKLCYGFLVAAGLVSCLSISIISIIQYLRFDVISKVHMSMDTHSLFPAVTICNMNPLRSRVIAKSNDEKAKQFLLYGRSQVDPPDENEPQVNVPAPDLSGDGVRKLHENYGHKLDKVVDGGMLIDCSYHGTKCSKDNFTEVFTDMGVCFTFNSGVKYDKVHVAQPGNRFGLSLTMLTQIEEYSLLPGDPMTSGFKVFVHDQDEMPVVDVYGFAVSGGMHTYVGVRKDRLVNLKSPYTTDCTTEGINFGSKYTRISCLQICREEYISRTCNCKSPLSFFKDASYAYCSANETAECVFKAEADFRQKRLSCTCKEPCETISYTTSLSFGLFPSERYLDKVMDDIGEKSNYTLSEVRKNIVKLDIFYEHLNYMTIVQTPAFSLNALYSNIGGILGASVGASIIALIELSDFILHFIWKRLIIILKPLNMIQAGSRK